ACLAGQGHNRETSQIGSLTKRPYQLVAAHPRHHDVGQHDVWMECDRLLVSFASIECRRDMEAFSQQAVDEKPVQVRVVLDQQHQLVATLAPPGSWRRS